MIVSTLQNRTNKFFGINSTIIGFALLPEVQTTNVNLEILCPRLALHVDLIMANVSHSCEMFSGYTNIGSERFTTWLLGVWEHGGARKHKARRAMFQHPHCL